jgi:hypothetical protein
MQRLADVTGGIWSAIMLVQEASASCKIEKRQTEQSSAEAPETGESRILIEPPHTISAYTHRCQLRRRKWPCGCAFITVAGMSH